MTKYFILYGLILFTFLILDALWLGLIAKNSYVESMGSIMREKFIIWPWLVFYFFYSFAILYLAILPNINSASVIPVTISALILGAAAYGAYNLTGYAIIKNWPLNITIMDWIWGSFVTAASASSAFWIFKKFIA
jgi:uncharacterized membrane protein